jgi:putative tricarboxylic transport membrane protein
MNMRIRVRHQQDLFAGLLFIVIALAALWIARDYPVGTAVRMSSGYFPRVLCLLLAGLGLYVAGRSLVIEGPPVTRIKPRPVVLVTLGVLLFAASVQTLGIVAAALLLTVVGGYASPRVRLLEMAATATVLAFVAVAVFIWGLGLPIPVWPEF